MVLKEYKLSAMKTYDFAGKVWVFSSVDEVWYCRDDLLNLYDVAQTSALISIWVS